jgi:hypothetical protein
LRRSIPLAIALLAALSATAAVAAAASSRPPNRVVRLEKNVRQLRSQVAALKASRAEARAHVAALTGQVSALTSENASLQATLAQRTSERDAARAQASSLQAQLAAVPTPLAVAVENVRRAVVYSEGVLDSQSVPYSYGQLVSEAAMNYVSGHVSAPVYGYDTTILGMTMVATPDAILADQAGICGSAALTFAAIVEQFGFDVRSVQFFYGPDGSWNHISDEVFYDGDWHYFDPTFALDYVQNGEVMSITAARAADDPDLEQDNTLFWTEVVRQAGITELDDLSFATDPTTTVVIDGQQF